MELCQDVPVCEVRSPPPNSDRTDDPDLRFLREIGGLLGKGDC